MFDPNTLRRRLKRDRAAIPPQARASAEQSVLAAAVADPRFRRARRLAAYLGSNGELDPLPLLTLAARQRKHCYLPILHPFLRGRLWFCRWRPGDPLVTNRYGIAEPVPHKGNLISPRWLDLVFVPLLGFDSDCQRLGMGGGYYDRTFAFVRTALPRRRRPRLIGLAFELQHVDAIPRRPWDVPLDSVLSESQRYDAP